MKRAKKTDPLPSTPEEWRQYAALARARQDAAARAEERADRKYRRAADREMIDRAARYATIGVAFGRDGVARWAGTGRPVLGGRRR